MSLPESEREYILLLAKFYRAHQNGSEKVTVARKNRIFDVNLKTREIVERDNPRSTKGHNFRVPAGMSDHVAEQIIKFWDNDRVNRNESRYFSSVVPYDGNVYLVDGSWETIELIHSFKK